MKIRGFAAAGQATTPVPTAFLADEVPDAPADYVKVYLYGLYLAGLQAPPAATAMEDRLHMTASEIEDAFEYWQRRGAVRVRSDGTVFFCGTGSDTGDVEPFPYVAFNLRLNDAFGREVTASELTKIYSWFETYDFPQDVSLMLVEHCIERKGPRIHINYIDKVASVWGEHGVDTVEKAQQEIDAYKAQMGGARQIMIRMGCRDRQPGKTELDLYEKWTEEYGFTHEGIVHAMEGREFNMTSPFKYLDAILRSLHESGAHTAQEIERVEREKSTEADEVKEALRMLGYQSTLIKREHLETYRTWRAEGHSRPVILLACAQATRYENRRMEHATQILRSWMAEGLKDEQAVRSMLAAEATLECQVQELYQEAGLSGQLVVAADLNMYRKYTQECNMDHDVLLYAASLSSVAEEPLRYMRAMLRRWAEASVTNVDQARIECARYDAEQRQKLAGPRAQREAPYAQRPPMTAAEMDQRLDRTLQQLQERYGTP